MIPDAQSIRLPTRLALRNFALTGSKSPLVHEDLIGLDADLKVAEVLRLNPR